MPDDTSTQPSTPPPPAQPPKWLTSDPSLPSRPIETTIRFPDAGHPVSAVFSPASDRLYVAINYTPLQLNWILRPAAYYTSLTLAALLFLFASARIIRVLRHRQVPGILYCRNCRYQLDGLTSPACPECGRPLTPRNTTLGRKTRTRLLLPLALIATSALFTLPAIYLNNWFPNRRITAPAGWADFAQRQGWNSIAIRTAMRTKIVELEVPSGRILRSRNHLGFAREPIALSHDARFLYLGSDTALEQLDLKTFNLRALPPSAPASGGPIEGISGISPDDRTIYVLWRNPTQHHPGTDKPPTSSISLIAIDTTDQNPPPPPRTLRTWDSNWYYSAVGPDPRPNAILIPGLTERFVVPNAGPHRPREMHSGIYDASTDSFTPLPGSAFAPSFTPDAKRLFGYRNGTLFETRGLSDQINWAVGSSGFNIDLTGTTLANITLHNRIDLYDLTADRFFASLTLPTEVAVQRVVLSPGGKVAATWSHGSLSASPLYIISPAPAHNSQISVPTRDQNTDPAKASNQP